MYHHQHLVSDVFSHKIILLKHYSLHLYTYSYYCNYNYHSGGVPKKALLAHMINFIHRYIKNLWPLATLAISDIKNTYVSSMPLLVYLKDVSPPWILNPPLMAPYIQTLILFTININFNSQNLKYPGPEERLKI